MLLRLPIQRATQVHPEGLQPHKAPEMSCPRKKEGCKQNLAEESIRQWGWHRPAAAPVTFSPRGRGRTSQTVAYLSGYILREKPK